MWSASTSVPDAETVTTKSHLVAAGGCIAVADAVLGRTLDCGFALVRPPGHHAMRVVLPVLEEFKPELIINSAGQDNHYSDPITQMNFCAQGYARLTERLRPYIAVLEGGYSIEGALPYVNVGLMLALAGLEYSWVREPGYDPERIRQDAEVGRLIALMCDHLLELRESCEVARKKSLAGPEFVRRNRTIFYDTAGVVENQGEMVRVCRDCAGTVSIDSHADTGYHILAIRIPRKAWATCVETGWRWFDQADLREYNCVGIQDAQSDLYQVKRQ